MNVNAVTRADVEDFLYHEAALLDDWRLDDWLELLAEDAAYYVPSTDAPASDHRKFNWMATIGTEIESDSGERNGESASELQTRSASYRSSPQ